VSDLVDGLNALRDAQDAYEEAAQFYDGTAPEIWTSRRLERMLRGATNKFRVNWARTTVTAVLDRLEINAITSTDEGEQTAIEELWADNLLGMEAPLVHESALEFGDAYVIVGTAEPDDDLEDETEIEFRVHGPDEVRMFYERENPHRAKYAVKAWIVGNGDQARTRVNLYYEDRIERYISKVKIGDRFDDRSFERFTDNDEDAWPEDNELGEIPVFHFRTRFPYGRPEHADAYGPQNMLNKLVATQMASIDFQALPQRYVLQEVGNPEAGAAPADDDFDDEPTKTTQLTDPNLVSAPGSVWWLPGAKGAGQFDPVDPASFLDPIDKYINAMATVTSTPMHLYELGGQPPTGLSLKRAEMPLIHKVSLRQLFFGQTWKTMIVFALTLAGLDVDPERIQVTWKPASLTDDKDTWDTFGSKKAMGVPVRQILMEAGYTADQCDTWGFTEAQPDGPEPTPEELAAQGLAANDNTRETQVNGQSGAKPTE
jgi:SPP1 Gp6-like portal protein